MPNPGPSARREGQGRSRRGLLSRMGDWIVLRLHRLADRLDRIPSSFGSHHAIDPQDAKAIRAEWLRCLRDWADYNPEEVFGLKVGAAMLLAGAIFLWVAIAFLL